MKIRNIHTAEWSIMRKVIVVSKTHLDLGFTDYAKNIKQKYIDTFIPNAINIAKEVNTDKKKFVWTTGSWILKEALTKSRDENKKELILALKNGNIAPHAMPFTTHTELLDIDTLDYGLSIVDELDKISGRKTIAAKMTDVPGHTIGLVPLLCKHGIKLLHIGVNGASALANVPPCFVWKQGKDEIIVIYSGDYGGEYKSDLIDDILYFDHTADNHGASVVSNVINNLEVLKEKYPDYEIVAGRMDDYAELIMAVKDKLPVIEDEICDSWIHGAASDPYKSAALRTLSDLKNKWLFDGSMNKDSEEYITLVDNLLCIAEHTCGMDSKCYFADYENYLRKDFDKARKKDKVTMKHMFRDFPQNFLTVVGRLEKRYKAGSYQVIEKSWVEQREYIDAAISKLSDFHKKEALKELSLLRPTQLIEMDGEMLHIDKTYIINNHSIGINGYGGISELILNGKTVIEKNSKPAVEYISYSKADYDFWLNNYSRNLKNTFSWAIGDFARPLLKYVDKKYKQGRFPYTFDSGKIVINGDEVKIATNLTIDDYFYSNLGAAKNVQIIYTIKDNKLGIEVIWLNKPANRLSESTIFHIYPSCINDQLSYTKIGTEIDPMTVVQNGNRNLSAVQNVIFKTDDSLYKIINHHSPLVSIGKGKILEFDNIFENAQTDGLSYILHNNVWGTNFPLWYEDNAYFKYTLEEKMLT